MWDRRRSTLNAAGCVPSGEPHALADPADRARSPLCGTRSQLYGMILTPFQKAILPLIFSAASFGSA